MKNNRVLVIEDDASVVVFVVDNLQYMDFDVSVARNGKDGLLKAQERIPDLVILDVMMPEMDGFEVCERLKADERTKNIPILMLTAKGQVQDKVMGFNVGADDYLPKPFEKEEFESRVKALLRRTIVMSNPIEAELGKVSLFLSYARADRSTVDEIYQKLSRQGYKPWMDVHDIIGGEDWLRAIYVAIDQCELFIPIFSHNSVSKRGVIVQEVKRALDKWNGMLPNDIYVIPIRLDDCPIPELVKNLQIIDWDGGIGNDKLFKAIHIAIKRKSQW